MVQMAAPALVPGDHLPPFMKWIAKGWVRHILNVLPPNERASKNIFRQIGHGYALDHNLVPEGFIDWYMDLQRYTDTMKNDGNMIGSVVKRYAELRLTDALFASVSSIFTMPSAAS